jgi:hypothetical protein
MIYQISAPISVTVHYNHHTRRFVPVKVTWEGRDYPIIKLGLHHTYRAGRTLYHIFSVASQNLFFRLKLDTDTLHWTLEEIADNITN